jgi:hypothetical protein
MIELNNIVLNSVKLDTANAAAQVILNRIDTQLHRLNNAWTGGGWNELKLTIAEINTTYLAARQNVEFLSFLGVFQGTECQLLFELLYTRKEDALRRKDSVAFRKAQLASDRQLSENAKAQAAAYAKPINLA